jgi:hypothetical protein
MNEGDFTSDTMKFYRSRERRTPSLMVADRVLPKSGRLSGVFPEALGGLHQTQAPIGAERDAFDAEALGQKSGHLGPRNLSDF